MDPLTERLIELVKDGAGLAKTARECDIGAEQVRRLLRQEALQGGERVARQAKQPGTPRAIPPQLAPAIEAMWSEGMLYHEIAEVLDSSCYAVHELIRKRVPASERAAQGRASERSAEDRLLYGMRAAADVLAGPLDNSGEHRSQAGVVAGQGAAADQPTRITAAVAPTERALEVLNAAALRVELDRFRADLQAGGLRESTIHAYLMGSSLFVRWLAGDYVPGPRREEPAPARPAKAPS